MSIHTIKDHQVWLLNAAFVPLVRIESELLDWRIDWRKRDECSFTCSIPLSSQFYGLLDSSADQFLLWGRLDKWQVFCIESLELAYNPRTRKKDLAQLAGKGGCAYFLDTRICAPNSAYGEEIGQEFTGKADDVVKEFVRANLSASALSDPLGNSRVLAGLTVAANKSEHPVTDTFFRQGNLWEALKALCQSANIDMAWIPTWNGPTAAVTFTFETYVPSRGIDRSVGMPDPVVLSDVYQVFSKSSWHCNNYPLRTHGYYNDGLAVIENPDATGHIRKEVILNSVDPTKIKEALEDMRPEQGHTFDFVESVAFQLGVNLWLGDTIPHYDKKLNTPIKVEEITGIRIQIQQDGSEKIELNFGDEKPTSTKNQGGGGARRRLPSGEGQPATTPWAGAGRIKPVASSNMAGTALAIPHGDHQHRAVLIGDDAVVVGPTEQGAFFLIGGTAIITHGDPETNSLIIEADLSKGWGLRDDQMTLVSPAADATIQIAGNTGYTVTAGTALLTVQGPWYRVAESALMYPRSNSDKVAINRIDCDSGDTYLDVNGNVRVNNYLYASEDSLNIYGAAGQVNVVDMTNPCALYVYNTGTPKVLLHSNSSSLYRGGGIHIENGHDLQLETGEGGGNVTGYWTGADGAITIYGGGNLAVITGGDTKAIIYGASGNLWLADAATTKLGGYTLTWPTSGAATGEYLKATVSGSNITLSWEDPTGGYSPHAAVTLSATLNSNLLALSGQELDLDIQPAAEFFAGPLSGGAAAPGFRAIKASDLGAGSAGDYILKATDSGEMLWISPATAAGLLSHSDLADLANDDHTQYLNGTRHEALVTSLHYGKAATGADAPGTTFEGIMWLDTDEEAPVVGLMKDLWFML